MTRKGILEEETKHIQEIKGLYPGALLLNTQKNTAVTLKTKSASSEKPSSTCDSKKPEKSKVKCPNCKRDYNSLDTHLKCSKAPKPTTSQ